jgi:protein-tyrosine phosphatase
LHIFEIFPSGLLSNVTLATYHRETYEKIAKYASMEDLQIIQDVMKLQERYLDASLNSTMDTYETFDRYLEAEFSIDEASRKHIQDYCLE